MADLRSQALCASFRPGIISARPTADNADRSLPAPSMPLAVRTGIQRCGPHRESAVQWIDCRMRGTEVFCWVGAQTRLALIDDDLRGTPPPPPGRPTVLPAGHRGSQVQVALFQPLRPGALSKACGGWKASSPARQQEHSYVRRQEILFDVIGLRVRRLRTHPLDHALAVIARETIPNRTRRATIPSPHLAYWRANPPYRACGKARIVGSFRP